MILLDTTILVSYLRHPHPSTRQLFQQHDAAICGVTRAEILHGARTEADVEAISGALDGFGQVPVPEGIWQQLGINLRLFRSRGIAVPFPDALIATVALHFDLELWADDAHYPLMQSALSKCPDPIRVPTWMYSLAGLK